MCSCEFLRACFRNCHAFWLLLIMYLIWWNSLALHCGVFVIGTLTYVCVCAYLIAQSESGCRCEHYRVTSIRWCSAGVSEVQQLNWFHLHIDDGWFTPSLTDEILPHTLQHTPQVVFDELRMSVDSYLNPFNASWHSKNKQLCINVCESW